MQAVRFKLTMSSTPPRSFAPRLGTSLQGPSASRYLRLPRAGSRPLVKASLQDHSQVAPNTSKTALRKLPKAVLEAELGLRQLEAAGTKPVLVDRLWAALQAEDDAQQVEPLNLAIPLQANTEGEAQALQAQVSSLDQELRAFEAKLDDASAAREEERRALEAFVAEMGAMKAEWVADMAELERLSAAAAQAEDSDADIAELQAQQVHFSTRLDCLAALVKDKEKEIASLNTVLQGATLQQLVAAGAGGESITVGPSGTALVTSAGGRWSRAQQEAGLTYKPHPLEQAFELPAVQPPHDMTAIATPDLYKRHEALGIALSMGLMTAADVGFQGWGLVRRLVPASSRTAVDVAGAAAAATVFACVVMSNL